MSLQAAILASLLSENNCSGYELSKQYNSSCVSTVWQVPQQQVYRELKNMESLGWVVSQEVASGGRLGKKLYEISELGKRKLLDWLTQPCEPAATRDELMVKMFAGYLVEPEIILAEIERHRKMHQEQLDWFEGIYQQYFSHGDSVPENKRFPYLVLKYRMGEEQHWVAWCQEARQFLKGQKPVITPS